MMNVSVIVPTYNAGKNWQNWIDAVLSQDIDILEVIVVDSSSTDDTRILAEQAGFSVVSIDKSSFNHGGTRNFAAKLANSQSEIFVFLTQDALLANKLSLKKLVDCFKDPEVSAAYGRQLPHLDATPLATFARIFNYPDCSIVKSKESVPELGLKTVFLSNSFAAYRRNVFEEFSGFPNNVILAEDMYLAAKMVLANHKLAYCAEATVYHSHNYTLCEEFKRCFDTGCFHLQEPWIMEHFGKASGEGKKFVFSELRYLLKYAPKWLPLSFLMTCGKAAGFYLGKNAHKIPEKYWHYFSMFRR